MRERESERERSIEAEIKMAIGGCRAKYNVKHLGTYMRRTLAKGRGSILILAQNSRMNIPLGL